MTPNAPGLWKSRSGRMVLVFKDTYLIYDGFTLLAGGFIDDLQPVEDWRPFTEPSFPPISNPELRCLVDVGSGPEWGFIGEDIFMGPYVTTRGTRTYNFRDVTIIPHAKNDTEAVELIEGVERAEK